MLGYEVIARELARLGVATVFGVMGDGNMHWIAAFRELPGTRWVPAWHEAAAVGMADGWAAARGPGTVGVATVTMGPGVVQALGALTAAARTRRPLLLITSEAPDTVPEQAQAADQRAWVRACGAGYKAVTRPEQLVGTLADALQAARLEQHPVVLSIVPSAFDAVAPDGAQALEEPVTNPESAKTAGAAVQEAGLALAAAARPVVLLGRGAEGEALPLAHRLAQLIGAPVQTTVPAKSAAPNGRPDGLTGMMADPAAREHLRAADAVLVIGAALDRYNTDGGAPLGSGTVIRVDRRHPDALWAPPSERTIHLTGESGDLVRQLLAVLEAGAPQSVEAWVDDPGGREWDEPRVLDLLAREPDDGPNPWQVVRALDAGIPDDAYVVVGIGHFWYFVAPYLRPASRRFQFGHGFAMIGQALPLAVGAAVAEQRRTVVAIEGDGSLPMNLVELQTAVREGVDLLVVVMDNAAYGSEIHKLTLAGLDPEAAAFDRPIDIAAVAEALGATARQASTPDELAHHLQDLVPRRGVRLVIASMSRSTMSEVYQRQYGGASAAPSH